MTPNEADDSISEHGLEAAKREVGMTQQPAPEAVSSEGEADGPPAIWLEPSCCADPHNGRCWSEDPCFQECDGHPQIQPTKYVRADLPSHTPEQPDSRSGAGARSGVYVASRASVPARGQMWRDARASGAPIISTWIDEDGEGQSHDLGDLWVRIEREVTTAERLILYVEPDDFPLKGAFIEVGMALAAGVPVVVVAPKVKLEPRSLRPLGSWAKHPLVRFHNSVREAFYMDLAPAQPQQTDTNGGEK